MRGGGLGFPDRFTGRSPGSSSYISWVTPGLGHQSIPPPPSRDGNIHSHPPPPPGRFWRPRLRLPRRQRPSQGRCRPRGSLRRHLQVQRHPLQYLHGGHLLLQRGAALHQGDQAGLHHRSRHSLPGEGLPRLHQHPVHPALSQRQARDAVLHLQAVQARRGQDLRGDEAATCLPERHPPAVRLQVGRQRPGRESLGRERELPGRHMGGVHPAGLHPAPGGARLVLRRRSRPVLRRAGLRNDRGDGLHDGLSRCRQSCVHDNVHGGVCEPGLRGVLRSGGAEVSRQRGHPGALSDLRPSAQVPHGSGALKMARRSLLINAADGLKMVRRALATVLDPDDFRFSASSSIVFFKYFQQRSLTNIEYVSFYDFKWTGTVLYGIIEIASC